MLLLVLGVALWVLTHSMRHTAPRFRKGLGDSQAKGLVSAAALVAIVLMVIGYRSSEPDALYYLGPMAIHLNNLLMVVAVALMMAPTVGSRLARLMRHPMLTALILWSIAHLLVAGEIRAFVLFGGLGLWAVVTILMTNRREHDWKKPKASARGDLILAAVTIALVALIGGIHIWLGLSPFGVSTT